MTHTAQANLIALIDSAEDLIWSVDIDYRLVAFNRPFQRIFELDYGVKAAVGMNPQDLLPPERAALWRPLYKRAFKEGPFRVEYSLVDGRILELSLNPIVVDGEATGVSVFGKDITDRERAQKHIAHLASFPELNPSFIFETDLDGKIVYLNPATARKFPALREAGAEHPLLKDWPAIIASLKANVGHPIGRKVAADGLTLLQTVNYVSEFEVVRAYCIDIAEREPAQQALQNSEEMFRQFAENIRDVIYMGPTTTDERHYVSPAYEEIWGRSCDSLYQNPMSWMEAIHPDDLAQAQSRFARQMQGEFTVSEYRIRTPNNQEKWIQDRAFPVRDQNGQLIRFGGISTDISERKRLESEMTSTIRALETSEEYYRTIFDQAAIGMIQTSFEGRFLRCNTCFAEIVGYPIEETLGLTFQQITAPDDLASSTMVLQRMASGDFEPTTWEKRYIRKDGTLTWVKITVSIQRDGEGRALHLIALVEDINARKAAEERLATATKVLQTSEERYRKLIEFSPNAVLVGRNHVIDIANISLLSG